MALIKCPECGKEISDKAKDCIHCGFPINDYLRSEEEKKEKYFCKICNNQNKIGEDYCEFCGQRITPYTSWKANINNEDEIKTFGGIYKYNWLGEKKEVYCPRCNSEDCSHYKEQHIVAGKTKTRYTANLNPLRPFTLVNKKEKQVTPDRVVTENKFMCNRCGYIFK